MARDFKYSLSKRKATMGKFKGKYVYFPRLVTDDLVEYRAFCEEVAHNTTFEEGTVIAVLMQAAKVAKRHVEDGRIVDLGDFGHLQPSINYVEVEVDGPEPFRSQDHIINPHAVLIPNKRYFKLRKPHYVRVPKRVVKGAKRQPNQPGPDGE